MNDHEKGIKRGIIHLMGDSRGRVWMFDFLSDCGLYETTFVAGQPDTSANLEGRRGAALRCLQQIDTHCPELYLQMLREARNDSQRVKDREAKDEESNDELE